MPFHQCTTYYRHDDRVVFTSWVGSRVRKESEGMFDWIHSFSEPYPYPRTASCFVYFYLQYESIMVPVLVLFFDVTTRTPKPKESKAAARHIRKILSNNQNKNTTIYIIITIHIP
jgi:hypothetical protein